jgi:uncharacterized protein YjgD (DUF1641 family)
VSENASSFKPTALEIEAMKELMEIAVQLKKSGILGMMRELLIDPESKVSDLEADVALIRLAGIIGVMMRSLEMLDEERVSKMRLNVEESMHCLLRSIADTEPAKVKPKGMLGLTSALRDPDVQKGLGFLLAIAKNLGSCLRKSSP